MNKLATLSKNGGLSKQDERRRQLFPTVSSFFDNWFMDDFPMAFQSDIFSGVTLPQVNITETADNYSIDMAVPGLKKSDFNIDVEKDVLSISTELEDSRTQTEGQYTRKEFEYASFKRTFKIPDTVDSDKINASYTDGILRLNLPKREEAKEKPPRTIEIS